VCSLEKISVSQLDVTCGLKNISRPVRDGMSSFSRIARPRATSVELYTPVYPLLRASHAARGACLGVKGLLHARDADAAHEASRNEAEDYRDCGACQPQFEPRLGEKRSRRKGYGEKDGQSRMVKPILVTAGARVKRSHTKVMSIRAYGDSNCESHSARTAGASASASTKRAQ
jgi:hypothetical protein